MEKLTREDKQVISILYSVVLLLLTAALIVG